jgi:stage III sporulation protein AD
VYLELGEILRACGIALIALSLCAVLKAKSVALSPYLTQTAALSIVITSLSALIPLFAFIKELSGQANINVSYLETMTLAGGIAFIAKITADICKENGENMLKSAVEFAANAQLLLITLPLLKELMVISEEILNI